MSVGSPIQAGLLQRGENQMNDATGGVIVGFDCHVDRHVGVERTARTCFAGSVPSDRCSPTSPTPTSPGCWTAASPPTDPPKLPLRPGRWDEAQLREHLQEGHRAGVAGGVRQVRGSWRSSADVGTRGRGSDGPCWGRWAHPAPTSAPTCDELAVQGTGDPSRPRGPWTMRILLPRWGTVTLFKMLCLAFRRPHRKGASDARRRRMRPRCVRNLPESL
jgi:hypothetical protein